jgi:hypothetical protein
VSRRKPRKPRPLVIAPGAQHDHIVEQQVGGRGRRLPVLEPIALAASWEFRAGVPPTRADCVDMPRPCPFVSCSHHLWLLEQASRAGNPAMGIQGETTLRPMAASCTLDVAARGGITLEEVGGILGLTATRVNQIERAGLAKLRAGGVSLAMLEAMR